MKTYAEQVQASAEIIAHINDGDALAKKMAKILADARTTLEALKIFAPDDKFKISAPYHLRKTDNPSSADEMSMTQTIDRQITVINNTLGDRASK